MIEVLLTMSLIALALGAMGFPIAKALKKERFERGVDQVIARINLAQELMLDTGCDVTLTFAQDEGYLSSEISAQTRLPKKVEGGINHHTKIYGITEIEGETQIYFDATVGAISQGRLRLSCGKLEEMILLKGYPSHVQRGNKNAHTIQEAVYPQEILSAF